MMRSTAEVEMDRPPHSEEDPKKTCSYNTTTMTWEEEKHA